MNDNQRVSAALERLFRTYPSQAKGANDFEIAQNRIADARVFLDVVAFFAAEDVETAVDAFLTGRVPGHNAAFSPSAPQVGSACRRAMEARLDSEERTKRFQPRLPKPDIEKTPEQRERAKAKMQEFIQSVGAADEHTSVEAIAAAKERWDRVNARFDPPQDEDSITDRLNLKRDRQGYSTGSPESEENAA